MDVERYILSIIPNMLKFYDPNKNGAAIDVGVGNFNFYCEVFAKQGYRTLAVEPLPSEQLNTLLSKQNIELVESCLLDKNGNIEIFSGIFNGNDNVNISSVNKDWWGVNDKSQKKIVPCVTLPDFIDKYKLNNISYFKIDTEGAEYSIIKQFSSVKNVLHPKIIEFEYGGGGQKKNQSGGWNDKYYTSTIDCIKSLYKIGYKYLVILERENNTPLFFKLNNNIDLNSIFKPNYVYGNILMFKKRKFKINKGKIKYTLAKNLPLLIKKHI